jgi:hypothetical protein
MNTKRISAGWSDGYQSEAEIKNGVNGISDIEGKAARVAARECGQRVSFNQEGVVNEGRNRLKPAVVRLALSPSVVRST